MEGGVHTRQHKSIVMCNYRIWGVSFVSPSVDSILSLLSAVKVFERIGETVFFSRMIARLVGDWRYINGGFIHVPHSRVVLPIRRLHVHRLPDCRLRAQSLNPPLVGKKQGHREERLRPDCKAISPDTVSGLQRAGAEAGKKWVQKQKRRCGRFFTRTIP